MKEDIYKAAPERYDGVMKYRRCGRSGVLLPEISLGLWQNFGDTAPLARSRQMLHRAFDLGITHFDLANNYGPSYGSAEETFGRVMVGSFAPYRDELFIATKAGYDMWPGPYGNWGSRKYLMASLDQSLRRMNLEYIDLFYSHRYDPDTPLEETLQALVDIVHRGKALYVGISRWPAEAAAVAYRYLRERDVPCLIYQGRLNMLDREVETSGVLAQSTDNGAGFIAFSPLAQGVLTDRYLNGIPSDSRIASGWHLTAKAIEGDVPERLCTLNALAAGRGQSLAQMALSWVLAHKGVTSVIVGASSVSQLEDSVKAVNSPEFTREELILIDQNTLSI